MTQPHDVAFRIPNVERVNALSKHRHASALETLAPRLTFVRTYPQRNAVKSRRNISASRSFAFRLFDRQKRACAKFAPDRSQPTFCIVPAPQFAEPQYAHVKSRNTFNVRGDDSQVMHG